MEFRHPAAAAGTNKEALSFFTDNLTDIHAGKTLFENLVNQLGNVVETYPEWHPIFTALPVTERGINCISNIATYKGADHTRYFVRGFITCPYNEIDANELVDRVNELSGGQLHAYLLDSPLYHDTAHPVVVQAIDVRLEADGTILSRDALAWFAQTIVRDAHSAEVAETWWNMRKYILGTPHGSRSSLLVNQHTGGHMRKILESINSSGMCGPIKESSLEMLSEKKRKTVSKTLLLAALNARNGKSDGAYEFLLRDEKCKAEIRDTWGDGSELSIRVNIGGHDLYTSGFYYSRTDSLDCQDPKGKKVLALKFL